MIIGTGLKGLNELEKYIYDLIIKEYNKLMINDIRFKR